ncbi:FAD/NAD(P)-binding domain-containing protein [Pyrenochaeta sp. DS3sAY3a]|nr:FAD/NAD(P)-binding domain-containing protein [Pyrenochaeta sp. DS3sAY3a]
MGTNTNGRAPEISSNGQAPEVLEQSAANGSNPKSGSTLPASTPKLKDEPVENFRPMRVVVIGGGFSGILLGIRIPEWLRNIDLTIYEKNDGLGGTWYENVYPGVACDIPAPSYVYTFEPNPDWSKFYAEGAEICRYLQKVAAKYSVNRFVKLQHEVVECVWDSSKLKWKIKVKQLETGTVIQDEADFIINARGGLNHYLWPKVDGLWDFKGKVMHSAAWDQSYDFTGKRIGIIGVGSSAIQIVPKLQKITGTKITCFARSKTWISTTFGESAIQKLGLKDLDFSKETRTEFASDPDGYHKLRKTIETEGSLMQAFVEKGSAMSEMARQTFIELMRSRLKTKPELADWLIPDFAPGCRRLTPGPGYLEALCEPNVDFLHEPIKAITPTGILLASGQHIEVDAIVCATGFDAAGPPPFPIIGLNNVDLRERIGDIPEAYLSMAVDGFPNFFSMLGANSGVASGSVTRLMESLAEYILKCVRKLQKEDIGAMHVSPRSLRAWIKQVNAYFPRTVFYDNCHAWYRRGDRVTGLWPGSTLHAIETLKSPRWEDYQYEYYEGSEGASNCFGWLGNGWSTISLNGGDVSYYIEREHVDFPTAPLPEDTKRWADAPWG